MKGNKRNFNDPNVRLSKKLAWLLRHNAEKVGLEIGPDGYVLVDDVLEFFVKDGWKDISFELIRQIVNQNDKKRYQLDQKIDPITEEKNWFIRATQGHSIGAVESEHLLTKIQDCQQYPVVIHGTYTKYLPLIEQQGLKRMNRNHIHFAPGFPKEGGVISGMRGSCEAYVEIDMDSAIKDGIPFYISSNNVILTEGIDGILLPKYFKKIEKRK